MKYTSEQYAEAQGAMCPSCGSGDSIEGDHVDINSGGAYQDCRCNECGAAWTDCYSLVGFDDFREGG